MNDPQRLPVDAEVWHPLTQPDCPSCHGLSKPVRKHRKAFDCGMAQLALSASAKLRRRLLQVLHDSRLPQDEFSESVLGIDSATLYRYLRGAVIPQSKARQIRSIEHVTRDGGFTVVVFRTREESTHWNSMLLRRARKAKRPIHLSAIDALREINA